MEYGASRGFPAEFVLLGLLVDGPAHGYDLQQRLHAGLGPVWRIAWSQLYNVLHSLEEQGRIRSSIGEPSNGPPRHTYTITPQGRRAFFEWAATPVARLRDVRVVFLAKLYFLRRHRADELDLLIGQQAEVLGRAIDALDAADGDPWVTSIATSFRRRQMQSALEWLDEVQKGLRSEREESR